MEESRAYWETADTSVPVASRPTLAFERRCLRARNVERIRDILVVMAERYDAFPEALVVLGRWKRMDAPTRRMICHWHLQLSDPLYRRFTAELLVDHRSRNAPIDRAATASWLRDEDEDSALASYLLTAGAEAGLITAKRDPRKMITPEVPERAVAYLLHLLRAVGVDPAPYLVSIGREGDEVGLPMCSSLTAWADATL